MCCGYIDILIRNNTTHFHSVCILNWLSIRGKRNHSCSGHHIFNACSNCVYGLCFCRTGQFDYINVSFT